MISYSRYGIRTGEVYFNDEIPEHPSVDILRCLQRPVPLPGFTCTPFHTSLLNVTAPPEQLLKNCRKETRYTIRRGEAAGFTITHSRDLSGALFTEIQELHRSFASTRRIAGIDIVRTGLLASAGRIALGLIRTPSGEPLAWHIWYVDGDRARCFVGGSRYDMPLPEEEKKLAPLANTYLLWQSILYFREHGNELLDFGGWYVGSDEKLLKINHFKAGFGGRVVEEFHCVRALTYRGKIAEFLKSARVNAPGTLGSRRPQPSPAAPRTSETEAPTEAGLVASGEYK